MHSIIIPFHDNKEYLIRAVHSVATQTQVLSGKRVEVVIGNDSNEAPGHIVDLLSSRLKQLEGLENLKIKVVDNVGKKGPGGNRNTAINNSTGSIISFLDSDDVWDNKKLEVAEECICKGYNFVATGYRYEVSMKRVCPPRSVRTRDDLLVKLSLGTSTISLTRDLLGTDRFSDRRFAQDLDLWLRLSRKASFAYMSSSSTLVTYGEYGTSKNKWIQLQSTGSVILSHGGFSYVSLVSFLMYIVRGIWRHLL